MFVVANGTPGLEPRPIRSMTGGVYHYEVFLDQVHVPKDYLLGKEDEGFTQLLAGLDTDRFWGRFYKAPSLKADPGSAGGLCQYHRASRPAIGP